MSNFKERLIGAVRLDTKIYEEIEADKTSVGQAIGVVVLSSIAAGLGTLTKGGGKGLLAGMLGALISWLIWAFITYLIGTKVLPESQTRADYGELLRTLGFSSAPGLIRIVGIIPILNKIIFVIASVWMLMAMVVAVRQALDYSSTMRAVCVCIIGWLVQVALLIILFSIIGRALGTGGAGV